MRRDLAVDFSDYADRWDSGFHWYVTGQDLLEQVKSVVGGLKGTIPAKNGKTKETAWDLTDHSSWIGAWSELNSNKSLLSEDIYLKVGGRIIKKTHKYKSGSDGSDGFYMSDLIYKGTDPSIGNIWSRKDGASYREYGRFMHDNAPISPLEQVTWSESVAKKLRRVLKGEKDYSSAAQNLVQSALPVLAATMFIAEPARNPREWLIGLMMLDLIGKEYSSGVSPKYYTFDKVMAHPDRIDRTKKGSDAPNKSQSGPSGNRYHWDRGVRIDDAQTLVSVNKVGDLASVEGKYPASPGGSAATSSNIDVANDYIQMKEASIVCRWVARKLNDGIFKELSSWKAAPLKAGASLINRQEMKTVATDPSDKARPGCARDLIAEIKRLITERAGSFD